MRLPQCNPVLQLYRHQREAALLQEGAEPRAELHKPTSASSCFEQAPATSAWPQATGMKRPELAAVLEVKGVKDFPLFSMLPYFAH